MLVVCVNSGRGEDVVREVARQAYGLMGVRPRKERAIRGFVGGKCDPSYFSQRLVFSGLYQVAGPGSKHDRNSNIKVILAEVARAVRFIGMTFAKSRSKFIHRPERLVETAMRSPEW